MKVQRIVFKSWLCRVILCLWLCGGASGTEPASREQLEFFEAKVRPLLVEHCYECHSGQAKKIQAGLWVDSRQSLLQGGDSGAALVPGSPDESLLIEVVNYESYEMPPAGKLPAEEIEVLELWVAMGAPWPEEVESPTKPGNAPQAFNLAERAQQHWAWESVASPPLPRVENTGWPQSELDHFILSQLELAAMRPAPPVDRRALLRRLYFDLIGLPPSPEEMQQFIEDDSPQAVERLVDRLLQSSHFGERWARHWLDLVRYAESRGHEFDDDAENAFQYRDYVIRALNADVPYDQWVREHIAGDLLTQPRLHPLHGFNESILGTGFWFLGEWVHSPVDIRKEETDRFDNMIDVMSKTFLGVTVACARCHDHKFDAISSADYYALSGFLQSSDFRQVRFESLEHNRQVASRLAEVDVNYRERIHAILPPELQPELLEHLSMQSTAQDCDGRDAIRQNEKPPADVDSQTLLLDYSVLPVEDFLQDGFVFGQRPQRAGDLVLDDRDGGPGLRYVSRTAASNDLFWRELKSVGSGSAASRSALSKLPRSGRTLRTPTFELSSGDVVCRVHGSGHVVACVDSHRLIAGPLHAETVVPIKANDNWVHLKLDRYVGHRLHLEFTPDEATQLEVALVLQGASPETLRLIERREAAIAAEVEERQQELERLVTEDRVTANKLAELVEQWATERRRLQNTIQKSSRLAMAMMDGSSEDDHVLIRGSSKNPGPVEPRHFLTAISGNQPLQMRSNSGRLELAAQINDPANPLTSRVIVNRLWHYLMGRGIVPTTDDFGVLGQTPTHPELLDHLATRFLADGRSLKRMIRYIVLSSTYQMSGFADSDARTLDPTNHFWHHRPPKRLEGEVIRDSLLAISGQLDATLYGESVPVHLTPFMDGRGRPEKSGPLDGDCRRSIYVSVRRNFLSPFMLTFDTPSPFSTMGRRNVSNVPAQALILMNDPFVAEQVQKWATRGLRNRGISTTSNVELENIDGLVDWFYQTAFARSASEPEKALAKQFVRRQAEQQDTALGDAKLWSDFAHALVNTKEFIYLR